METLLFTFTQKKSPPLYSIQEGFKQIMKNIYNL